MALGRVWWLVALATGLAACKDRHTVTVPLPNQDPPVRAASSFVHCIEAGTSLCVKSEDTTGGWDAFYLLTWLSTGSPVAILEALPRELADHADPQRVQDRFVDEVERYATTIRGAECDASEQLGMDKLIDAAAELARRRLERLGLWQRNMATVVDGLAEEAHDDLGGGYLVRLECVREPYRVYVATRERDGEHHVVGMTTLLPAQLGGDAPSREAIERRLESRALGLDAAAAPVAEGDVHAWLPFPVEEF
jgi:hypothetical protein